MLKKTMQYFLYFLMYSVTGWLYEVFLEVAVYRWGFSNRGVLHGPYCIIYGFGALVLIFSLSGLKQRRLRLFGINIIPLLVFFAVAAIATALELFGSYIAEFLTGAWQWDYTRFPCNFEGRIALNPSLRFGIGGMIFLYVLQPLFVRTVGRLNGTVLKIVSGTAAALFFTDVITTLIA